MHREKSKQKAYENGYMIIKMILCKFTLDFLYLSWVSCMLKRVGNFLNVLVRGMHLQQTLWQILKFNRGRLIDWYNKNQKKNFKVTLDSFITLFRNIVLLIAHDIDPMNSSSWNMKNKLNNQFKPVNMILYVHGLFGNVAHNFSINHM